MKIFVSLFTFGVFLSSAPIQCAQKRSNPFYLSSEVDALPINKAVVVNALILVEGRNAALLSNGVHSKVVYSGEIVWGHRVEQVHKDHVVLVKGTEKIVLRM